MSHVYKPMCYIIQLYTRTCVYNGVMHYSFIALQLLDSCIAGDITVELVFIFYAMCVASSTYNESFFWSCRHGEYGLSE
jgi:hypothetical protein